MKIHTVLSLCMYLQDLTIISYTLGKKDTILQLTTMLSTSKNVLFPGSSQLLTTDTDYPSLAGTRAITKVSGHQHQWLAGG